jgi:hypothetical protein
MLREHCRFLTSFPLFVAAGPEQETGWSMRISVVTPSFNMAPYLEDTLASVIGNLRPGDEYFVIDGGSNDGSVDIIRRQSRTSRAGSANRMPAMRTRWPRASIAQPATSCAGLTPAISISAARSTPRGSGSLAISI